MTQQETERAVLRLVALALCCVGLAACVGKLAGVPERHEAPHRAPSASVVGAAPAPPFAPAPEPTAPSGWATVPGFPPLLDERLAPYFEQLRADADPANWFLSHPEPAPLGFRRLPGRRRAPFPGPTKPARVVAHFFGEGFYPRQPQLDVQVPGCGGGLIGSNGARCPSVRYPGKTLSDAQIAELLSIANTPNDVPRVVMDGYHFDRGFLFFDGQGLPFAQLLVSRRGNKLLLLPSPRPYPVDTLSPPRRERLAALLADLSLSEPVLPDELRDALERQSTLDGGLRFLRFLPASSGVARTTSLSAVDRDEAERLCFWYARAWSGAAPGPGSGMECASGFRAVGQEVQDCMHTLPRCDVSVGEVEECWRRQRLDPCLEREENRRCEPLRKCFWGMVPVPPSESETCDPLRASYWLELLLAPGDAQKLLLARRFVADEALCDGSHVYLRVSGDTLFSWFGRYLEVKAAPGACRWLPSTTSPDFVPAVFEGLASSVRLETDAEPELKATLKSCGP